MSDKVDDKMLEMVDKSAKRIAEDDNSDNDSDPTELKDMLRECIGDMIHQYLQFRQHHWNVTGRTFRDIHLMFDEASDEILEQIDRFTERSVAFGVVPPTLLTSLIKVSDIPTIDEGVTDSVAMIQQSLDGLAEIIEDINDVVEKTAELELWGFNNLAADVITNLEVLVYKFQQFAK